MLKLIRLNHFDICYLQNTSRTDKHDLSDIIGILYEQQKTGNNLEKENIENAFLFLYNDIKHIPEKSILFLNQIFNNKNFETLFYEIKKAEKKEREFLENNEYPEKILF